jgi:hypothetical protein
MVQYELPISVLFITGIGPHLLFYNHRRERLGTTSENVDVTIEGADDSVLLPGGMFLQGRGKT